MQFKLVLICLGVFPVFLHAQDSIKTTKQSALVDRFENITGKEINYKDTVVVLKARNKELKQEVLNKVDSLKVMEQLLVAADKKLLIAKYGADAKQLAYGKEQYEDFSTNWFLKSYLKNGKKLSVHYAFIGTEIDLKLYEKELQFYLSELKKNPKTQLVLEGYADSEGTDEVNMKLSKLRAENVKNQLVVKYGIPAAQIEMKSFGKGGSNRDTEKELDFLNRKVVVYLK